MEKKLNFGERNGYCDPNTVLVRECMPTDVITSISNTYIDCFSPHRIGEMNKNISTGIDYRVKINRRIWRYFLNRNLEDFKVSINIVLSTLKKSDNPWYNGLSLLEEIISSAKELGGNYISRSEQFSQEINYEFSRLNYGYRFIGGIIVEINSEEEIISIETAIANNDGGVKTHLKAALGFLSPLAPDYRNSVKESISAVEAICRIITGKNEFGPALDELKKQNIEIHQVLSKGLKSIYGYTCNKDTGIRHALIEEGYTTTQEDAVYMLVLCSAFINYINAKRAK